MLFIKQYFDFIIDQTFQRVSLKICQHKSKSRHLENQIHNLLP
jgi:hypothetical protein